MSPSETPVPPLEDLSISNITDNTILTSSNGPSPRLTFILQRLVTHLHDFARETRLDTQEWTAGIEFLTKTGQKCTETRQEFILLSDVLGLSVLVDSIAHPRPPPATEGSVLGPFHTHDPPSLSAGDSLSHDANGTPCLVLCSVRDPQGAPIPDVEIDIWETDSTGHYDVHYETIHVDGRGVIRSDADGKFWLKGIVPVSYPIPDDGPVGKLLELLGRHVWRPAHVHFWLKKKGWDELVTALYISDDPYINSDAVFGVKPSLCVKPTPASSDERKAYDVPDGARVIKYDFVLVKEEEARKLREEKNREAVEQLGDGKGKWKLDGESGLPVVDVD